MAFLRKLLVSSKKVFKQEQLEPKTQEKKSRLIRVSNFLKKSVTRLHKAPAKDHEVETVQATVSTDVDLPNGHLNSGPYNVTENLAVHDLLEADDTEFDDAASTGTVIRHAVPNLGQGSVREEEENATIADLAIQISENFSTPLPVSTTLMSPASVRRHASEPSLRDLARLSVQKLELKTSSPIGSEVAESVTADTLRAIIAGRDAIHGREMAALKHELEKEIAAGQAKATEAEKELEEAVKNKMLFQKRAKIAKQENAVLLQKEKELMERLKTAEVSNTNTASDLLQQNQELRDKIHELQADHERELDQLGISYDSAYGELERRLEYLQAVTDGTTKEEATDVQQLSTYRLEQIKALNNQVKNLSERLREAEEKSDREKRSSDKKIELLTSLKESSVLESAFLRARVETHRNAYEMIVGDAERTLRQSKEYAIEILVDAYETMRRDNNQLASEISRSQHAVEEASYKTCLTDRVLETSERRVKMHEEHIQELNNLTRERDADNMKLEMDLEALKRKLRQYQLDLGTEQDKNADMSRLVEFLGQQGQADVGRWYLDAKKEELLQANQVIEEQRYHVQRLQTEMRKAQYEYPDGPRTSKEILYDEEVRELHETVENLEAQKIELRAQLAASQQLLEATQRKITQNMQLSSIATFAPRLAVPIVTPQAAQWATFSPSQVPNAAPQTLQKNSQNSQLTPSETFGLRPLASASSQVHPCASPAFPQLSEATPEQKKPQNIELSPPVGIFAPRPSALATDPPENSYAALALLQLSNAAPQVLRSASPNVSLPRIGTFGPRPSAPVVTTRVNQWAIDHPPQPSGPALNTSFQSYDAGDDDLELEHRRDNISLPDTTYSGNTHETSAEGAVSGGEATGDTTMGEVSNSDAIGGIETASRRSVKRLRRVAGPSGSGSENLAAKVDAGLEEKYKKPGMDISSLLN